jgi:hypothetical protein
MGQKARLPWRGVPWSQQLKAGLEPDQAGARPGWSPAALAWSPKKARRKKSTAMSNSPGLSAVSTAPPPPRLMR